MMYKWLQNLFRRRQSSQPISQRMEIGFHGDKYLISYIDKLIDLVENFIETGANVGTTLSYVARTYPELTLYSCEPTSQSFNQVQKHLQDINVSAYFYNMRSPDFIYYIHQEFPNLRYQNNLYWLDAHGHGYKWPLDRELEFITQTHDTAIIIVDDSEVPDRPQFVYASYDDKECNRAYIQQALTLDRQYMFVYPTYTEHTSPHHPLVGHTIIVFGDLLNYIPEDPNYSHEVISL